MNRKADYLLGQEAGLYFIKMILVVVIAVFIFIFVYAFFYHEYDVRQIEANILASKVARCYFSSGEASLSDFEKTPKEKCKIDAGDDYYTDIVLLSGFPKAKCEGDYGLGGVWKKNGCDGGFVDIRNKVSDLEDLSSHLESEKWRCCIQRELAGKNRIFDGGIITDGGKNQEDLRVLCDVLTNGNRPEGDYEKACSRDIFNFILISDGSRIQASVLIKSGFKKRAAYE